MVEISSLTVFQSIVALVVIWLVWVVVTGIYNLTLHPLAVYPGPKLAAFTIWWKVYVELVDEANLCEKLFQLHRQYGMKLSGAAEHVDLCGLTLYFVS